MERESMRAGDSDRQQVADQLKAALDEGRLDLFEYDERVQRAYAARTYGDLDGLLRDLPGTVPARQARLEPVERAAAAPVTGPQGPSRGGVRPALSIFAVCTLVWVISSLATGTFYYFWPAWVLIPVLFAVLGSIRGRDNRADRNKGRC